MPHLFATHTHLLHTQVGGVPGGPREWEWFHPEVVGPAPSPRTGHAACLLGDGKTILVQGGWDPQDAASEETKVCVTGLC